MYSSSYKCSMAFHGTPFQSHAVSLSYMDHAVLPVTRHKRTHPALRNRVRVRIRRIGIRRNGAEPMDYSTNGPSDYRG